MILRKKSATCRKRKRSDQVADCGSRRLRDPADGRGKNGNARLIAGYLAGCPVRLVYAFNHVGPTDHLVNLPRAIQTGIWFIRYAVGYADRFCFARLLRKTLGRNSVCRLGQNRVIAAYHHDRPDHLVRG